MAARAARPSPGTAPDIEIAGVRLSHPDRVLFPDGPYTKRDVAEYYVSVADAILPHLADRPLTVVRCPGAVGDECFFVKHAGARSAGALRRVRIREKTKTGDYVVADTLAALITLVQMGVTEIHTWNARHASLETPDRLVFDLDPGPDVSWAAVVEAARLVRATLEQVSLPSFVKTTGGKGLHVVAPIVATSSWDEGLAFARHLAEGFVQRDPTRFTTRVAKAGREKKILIDYQRNSRGNTAVAAYSTRARAGAPVSMPLGWDALSEHTRPDEFTLRTVPALLASGVRQAWDGYASARPLPRGSVLAREVGQASPGGQQDERHQPQARHAGRRTTTTTRRTR